MKKLLVLALVALVVPSVALAAKPNPPGQSQDSRGNSTSASRAPYVLYVLKGVLTAYAPAPASSACPTSGSVTIIVNRANHYRKALKSQSLQFCVDPKTKIVVKGGGDLTTVGPNSDRGIVKVRYLRKFDPTNADQLTALQTAVAKQVIDKGPVPAS